MGTDKKNVVPKSEGGEDMRILFYDAKEYDKEAFDKAIKKYSDLEIEYTKSELSLKTSRYAEGFRAVCGFVNSDFSREVLEALKKNGVELILLRCAGFNNVDLKAADELGFTVLRVPGYSPEAVAEHAMTLAMTSNRRIHKSYIKVRENNFSLNGLTGVNLYKKTAGIVGTGKIGAAMCRICHGFGMRVIAYDLYPNKSLDFVEYVDMDTLLKESDLISLHCPLTDDSYHMIDIDAINKMKDGVILVNTSRGALIDSEDLIKGIREYKFHSVGLDVYEEEGANVFENRSSEILQHSIVSRLLSFPNVVVTSHQAFLTQEALDSISSITLENAKGFIDGNVMEMNRVTAK